VRRQVAWVAALMVLGMLIVVQWRSAAPAANARASAPPAAAQTVALLEAEQAALKQQIADLRARLAAYERRATQGRDNRGELSRALEQERLAAGLVALKGPGVKIVADDTTLKSVPQGEDPNRFIVHEYDLRDIVNFLWLNGAEAIAINGERLVSTTSIYCVGTTIMVNDTRLSPPFEIVAIGDAVALERAINDPQALRSFKESVRRYSLVFTVSREREVRLPAFNGSFPFKYAQPGSTS
jgi:uncharacterized protein YlxW (UPF0749 family)